MDQSIPAIFDSGVFRPLQPVDLAPGTPVQVQVKDAEPAVADATDQATNEAWNAYLDRMESLPSKPSQDGLTGRDHDRIIYGA